MDLLQRFVIIFFKITAFILHLCKGFVWKHFKCNQQFSAIYNIDRISIVIDRTESCLEKVMPTFTSDMTYNVNDYKDDTKHPKNNKKLIFIIRDYQWTCV